MPLPRDTRLLFATRAVRLFAYGALGVVLVLYLSSLGLSEAQSGAFLSAVLLGDSAVSLALSAHADHIGRRNLLVIGAVLMLFSGAVFAIMPREPNLLLLILVGIVGVISPSGNEVGPFSALEQSVLAQFTTLDQRPRVFGFYQLTASLATAFGSLAAGVLVSFLVGAPGSGDGDGEDPVDEESRRLWAYRITSGIYGGLAALLVLLFSMLSKSVESPYVIPYVGSVTNTPVTGMTPQECTPMEPELETDHEGSALLSPPVIDGSSPTATKVWKPWSIMGDLKLSPESRSTVIRLCLLFMLDAFGSSLITGSFLAYWFRQKYSVGESYLGSLLFTSNIIIAGSALVSAWICGKIGLINTMVFTHIPANTLAILIPFMPNLTAATAVIFVRSSISQMDTVPRAAYVASVVPANERTAVIGLTNIVRTLGAAFGPLVTGYLAHNGLFDWAFVLSGSVCILYDMLILLSFRAVRPVGEDV